MKFSIGEIVVAITILAIAPSFAQEVPRAKQLQRLENPQLPTASQLTDVKYCGTDGRWMSFEVITPQGDQELYVVNLGSGAQYEVTAEQAITDESTPERKISVDSVGRRKSSHRYSGELVWNPNMNDGNTMYAFVGNRRGNIDVYVGFVHAPDEVYRMTLDGGDDDQPRWSPDGNDLVFTSRRNASADVYRIRDIMSVMEKMRWGGRGIIGEQVDRGRHLEQLTRSDRDELDPMFTPDGNHVVYTVYGKSDLGDVWASRIAAQHLEVRQEVVLVENRSRFVQGASFSADGNTMAHYSSDQRSQYGEKPVPTNLVVRQVLYNERREITGSNVRWPEGTVTELSSVKAGRDGYPYWTREGSLLFQKENFGSGNSILELPARALSGGGNPYFEQMFCVDEAGQGLNITSFDFFGQSVSGNIGLTARSGGVSGVYWTKRPIDQVRVPSVQSSPQISVGISGVSFLYAGDADMAESWGGEVQSFIPLGDKLLLVGSAGYGSIRAKIGTNDRTLRSNNSFSYATLQLGYRFTDESSIAVFGAAGFGIGNFANDVPNPAADGIKLLIPIGVYVGIPLSESLSLNSGVAFTFTNLDIDALPTAKSSEVSKQEGAESGIVDRFFKFTVGFAISL